MTMEAFVSPMALARRRRSAFVAALVLTCSGCGYSHHHEYYAIRGVRLSADLGDGSIIVRAPVDDEATALAHRLALAGEQSGGR